VNFAEKSSAKSVQFFLLEMSRLQVIFVGRGLTVCWGGQGEERLVGPWFSVPYAKLDSPQSLNLYAYVGNNPLKAFDPDGHCGSDDGLCVGLSAGFDMKHQNNDSDATAQLQAGLQAAAQQQNGSSSGGGFLHWLGHGLSNWAHLQSWNYIKATVTAEDVGPHEPHEPNGYVTAATDAAGLGGLAASEKVAKPLGRLGAAASILNDPSPKNITTNVLGLLPGFDGPMAITGAFNDFLDWGINNGTGRVSPKAYDNDQLRPTLPTQDGGCLAAGSDFPC
jgi:hypothetical protein